ncbi:MAG: hypothetical protein WBM32_04425 [Crocosphaera sp.]
MVNSNNQYDTQITLIEDTALYEKMLSQGDHKGQEVDCFVMDSKVIRLPCWHSFKGDLVLFEEMFKVLYQISPDKGEICLFTPEYNPKIRMPLMRVIRELAMNQSMTHGGLFIHGAAFAVGNQGVILAGPKGAGKTTLLLHAFRHQTTQYLSSDRVLVSLKDGEIVFRGMPTIPSILPSTLDFFPSFRNRLLSSGFHYLLTIAEAQALKQPTQLGEIGKFGLTPAQFCHLLDLSPVAEVQGFAFVFPKVTHNRGKFEFSQLSPEAASEQLRATLLGSYSLREQEAVFAISGTKISVKQAYINALCQNIAVSVPCYQCQVGTDAYENTVDINDFVDFFF